jgi:hypothetical protein
VLRRIVSIIGFTVVVAALAATAASAAATSFSGRATAARASVLGVTLAFADTGALPTSGGSQDASFAAVNLPGILTTGVLTASTVGRGNHSRSEASVGNVAVLGNLIMASAVTSQAEATCRGSEPQTSGSSNLANLTVAGQPVAVVGSPVITIPLLGITIAVNEQTSSTNGGHGEITVNALHVSGPGIDIVVASSQSDIDCKEAPAQ